MRGEAEAYAVEAKGRAEAEQMAKKAEAFQQYKEGAMVDMLLEKLPLVRYICNGVFLVCWQYRKIFHCTAKIGILQEIILLRAKSSSMQFELMSYIDGKLCSICPLDGRGDK